MNTLRSSVLAFGLVSLVGCIGYNPPGRPDAATTADTATQQPVDAGQQTQDSAVQQPVDAGQQPVDTGVQPQDSGVTPPPADVQQPVDNGPRCFAPRGLCGTNCVDTNTDTANCGFCGRTCPSGNTCVAGVCTLTCAAPLALCGSTCVNNQMDVANCGGCGHACAPGQYCAGGSCATPGPVCMSGSMRCPGITTCVAVLGDRNNCGACGNRCPSDQACLTGVCRNPCAAGETLCGLTTCIDTRSDVANCGACGNRCSTGYSCVAGVCNPPAPSCIPSMCPVRSNANSVCTAGSCGFACYLSYGNCNGNAGDGCETALTTNFNCGACGRTCSAGTNCQDAMCVAVPPPPSRFIRAHLNHSVNSQFASSYVCTWDLNADGGSVTFCSSVAGGQLYTSIVGPYFPGNHLRIGVATSDPRTMTSGVVWIVNEAGNVGRTARSLGFDVLQIEQTGVATQYLLDSAVACIDVCHPSYGRGWRESKLTVPVRAGASVCPSTCDAP